MAIRMRRTIRQAIVYREHLQIAGILCCVVAAITWVLYLVD
jgi:hypothetical protein